MNKTDTVELNIEVSIPDATDEELDNLARQLLLEVRDLDIESAELAKGKAAPEGTKGDPITIGSIALVVLPALLPKVVDMVQAWVLRGHGRTVKFKGKGIEFEGSSEELQKLLKNLEKGKKRR
jgi:hypothetical protein